MLVVKEFAIQHRRIFIGEVARAHVDGNFVRQDEDRPRITNLVDLNPILYALNNNYYSMGQSIGVGYQENGKMKDL